MATSEMAAADPTESQVDSEVDFPSHRLTVDVFERMIDAGVFGEKSPVFLWNGRLVEKMAPGLPHVFVVSRLDRIFIRLLPEGWYSLQEQPVIVGEESLPEPDISIVQGSLDDYLQGRPTVDKIALLIEVADSSLSIDSNIVLRTYARAGIPAYWIVNIRDRRIEVFRDPEGSAYKDQQVYGPDDMVPVVLDGVEVGRVAVREVLP